MLCSVYDATGYYGGGFLAGQQVRIRNPDNCRKLLHEYFEMLDKHWNLRVNTTVVPFPVQLINAKYIFHMSRPFEVSVFTFI